MVSISSWPADDVEQSRMTESSSSDSDDYDFDDGFIVDDRVCERSRIARQSLMLLAEQKPLFPPLKMADRPAARHTWLREKQAHLANSPKAASNAATDDQDLSQPNVSLLTTLLRK